MKIAIGNDHRAVELKFKIINYLKKQGHEVINVGSDEKEFSDFPIYAFEVGKKAANNEIDFGILICGTGAGMALACNKVKGAYCVRLSNKNEAYYAKHHNNANVVSFSSSQSLFNIKKMLKTYINAEFSTVDKYQKRIDMIKEYENGN